MKDGWWVNSKELNAEQRKVIELPKDGNHLIVGPPGSGKTNLLLLRAKYLARTGLKNIAILTFTRTLQEFLVSGSENYNFSKDKLKTFRQWQIEILKDHGLMAKLPEDFQEARTFFIEKISNLIAAKKLKPQYEAILLDEAQDFLPDEIDIIHKLSERIFAVADDRQKIYAGQDALDKLKGITQVHKLTHHYRNGQSICKLADGLAKYGTDYELMLPTCNYVEKTQQSSVEICHSPDLDGQAKEIIKRLEVQLKAYPNELIGIVCPRHSELSMIWSHISDTALADVAAYQKGDTPLHFDPKVRIAVCALHSAKGLEFRAMHFAGAEYLKRFQHQRNLAYMAVTRAKTSLTIHHSDDLPGYLEQALMPFTPEEGEPGIDDLFEKGG